jgi:uncharacterized protein (TIGR00251 family)
VIVLTEHAQGWILPVRAQPGARKVGVTGERAGALKLAVNAPPENGKANLALTELLCQLLGLKRSQVALFSGAASRDKRFLICGAVRADLEKKIGALLRQQS